jgi:hypothetical protein
MTLSIMMNAILLNGIRQFDDKHIDTQQNDIMLKVTLNKC